MRFDHAIDLFVTDMASQGRLTSPGSERAYRDTLYLLTREEVARMLAAASTRRERRVIFLGICAGLRNQELRGLQGRHFERPGWIWISGDIAKGGRERWIPVIEELA